MKLALKIVGIVLALFIVGGFLLTEVTRQIPNESVIVVALPLMAVIGIAAAFAIRHAVRSERSTGPSD